MARQGLAPRNDLMLTGLKPAPTDAFDDDARPAASVGRDTRAKDRRQHQRVPVDSTGRFMLPTREEHDCRLVDMSPGGASIRTAVPVAVGTRVIAYIDHIGRLEGDVVRHTSHGFAMTVRGTARRRDKLASQLTYLANRDTLKLPEDRRHDRVSLTQSRTRLYFANGEARPCTIVDASASGAAVAISPMVEAGTPVHLGRVRGRVVRQIEGGVAVEFSQVQDVDLLERNLFGAPSL